ncbi:unnamed protein product [Protopolystoma xenopodis]|uniref:Uncharacterized protein n=1 Tax=Protopolystoma xenopodis TaxID=117903 RepID=A0A448XAJ8_9PLAT|nr:unnamed protein product [Protopolystoma xenopodis]
MPSSKQIIQEVDKARRLLADTRRRRVLAVKRLFPGLSDIVNSSNLDANSISNRHSCLDRMKSWVGVSSSV